MARPILRTPELKGEDAKRFLELHSEPTISSKDKEILQSCVELYRRYKE